MPSDAVVTPATTSPGAARMAPLLSSKVALPHARPGSVVRRRLLERLTREGNAKVITVVAPAGYGKSTLVRQWAEHAPEVTCVQLDRADNDPILLLRYVAEALGRVTPLDPSAVEMLATPGLTLEGSVLPRFGAAVCEIRQPATLVLDDFHVLEERACLDALTWLLRHCPSHIRFAPVGRSASGLPLGRLRAEGRVLELGPGDLAFDLEGARELALGLDIEMAQPEIAEMVERTEGWPALLFLALLARRSRSREGPAVTRGDHWSIADYLRTELLDPLEASDRVWLTRSAVLEHMRGPLCDAALEASGSLARLRDLASRNPFVVPIDDQRTSYRYHHLLRDVLLDELRAGQPGEAEAIAARASAWCAANGDLEAAVGYARASGDLEVTARVVGRSVLPLYWQGRQATVNTWLGWFDHDAVREAHAAISVFGGILAALKGDARRAQRWLAAAERSTDRGPMPDGSANRTSWVALLRAMMMPSGLSAMRADVQVALEGVAADGSWRQVVHLLDGVAHFLEGAPDKADEAAAQSVRVAQELGATPGQVAALGLRAMLALRRGDRAAADALVRECLTHIERAGLWDISGSALGLAIAARLALASGSLQDARRLLGQADRLRPVLTVAVPWNAAMVRLEIVRFHLALGEAGAARTLLLEIGDVLRARPDLGVLATETAEVRRTVEGMRESGGGPWALTTAELRLLAYLPTHLTFREIAQRMSLSPHTIKTQAISIYGKLGVSSRRGAIEGAVAAGLLDPGVLRAPGGGEAVA